MIRKLVFTFVFFVLLSVLRSPGIAHAACSTTADCNYLCSAAYCGKPYCTNDCEVVYPAKTGSCYSTCDAGSTVTLCTAWTSWGPCGGGYQERYCTAPATVDDMQVRLCEVSGPPGGGPTPTPGPTPEPGCVDTAPTAVALSSPANGADLSNMSVTLSWVATTGWGTGCPQDNKYNVYVDTVNPPTTLVATTTGVSSSFTATPGSTYYWRVMTFNGTQAAYSSVRSFTTQASISGTVYIDNGNTCSTAVTSTLSGLTARVRGTAYSATVSTTTGAYSFVAPAASYANLDLLGMSSSYTCSTGCVQSCPTIPTVSSQSVNNNFFITTLVSGWWQVKGASVYAGSDDGGVTVQSQLPSASTKLILPGTTGTAGALIRGSGSTALGLGGVSTDLWSTVSSYKGKRMDYNYFSAQMGVVKGQASDWQSDTLNLPAYDPAKAFLYIKPTSGTATVSTPWTVGVGEKYVIFVNGILDIEQNITVAPGGFLAFIVSGNIIISPPVSGVQGMYIASGNITSESQYVLGVTNDVQLDAQGSFIAWASLTLSRNLGAGNATTPGEKFTYRPDLLINMPENMKTFAMQWQEVPAGTFGE